MRSEQTRSSLSRPLAKTMLLLASGLACSTALGAPNASSKQFSGMEVQNPQMTVNGWAIESVTLDSPNSASSEGLVIDSRGFKSTRAFTNNVIVRSDDWSAVNQLVEGIPGLSMGSELGSSGEYRYIQVATVADAFEIQSILSQSDAVQSVSVDSGLISTDTPMSRLNNELFERVQQLSKSNIISNRSTPAFMWNSDLVSADPDVGPQGIPAAQWNFEGTSTFGYVGNDNNLLSSIYDTDLITGAGVNIGICVFRERVFLDVDHPELVNPGGRQGGYLDGLSQTYDPNIGSDDTFLTGYAGIIAAERTADPTDLHGVAPEAGVASLFRGPSRLRESQAYEWESQRLDIKVHELVSEYTTQGFSSDLIPGGQNEFVFDSFKNSVKFGRGRKGTIHIFGSGFNVGLQPDPYNYGTPYVWDVVSANPNLLGVSLTNGFLTQTLGALGAAPVDAVRTSAPVTLEQFYITSQTHYYALANDRDSLIINTVGEDGNLDLFSPIGPGVFASVYAGTNNGVFSGNQAAPNGSGRGVLTIGPFGATNVEIPPPLLAGVGGNQSAAMTAAGIVALMLDANPNLTPRDIQHIFFRSIQESTKPGATKWPNFDFVNNRLYYTPFAAPSVLRDFWQVNNGFYNNPNLVPPIENQSIRHSDQYGFGIIDANAAIQMARTWNGAPPLIRLDSGLVGDLGLGGGGDDDDVPGIPFEPIAIADATFTDPDPEPDGAVPPVTGQSSLVVGPGLNQFRFCVRDNIQIENIVVELTVSGAGSNDLYVTLTSPTGTSSNLVLPTTSNISGMTEGPGNDELEGFTANTVNGTTYAYFQHPILTHKHWGELSGGYWTLDFYDFGPDVENPAGVPTGDDPAMEPGADTVVNLGEIGVPGSTIRGAKTVTALRIEIFGTDTNVLPFLGCDPFTTSCPADLNADGRIDVVDLQLFLNWYQNGDIRADINSDGQLDFGDIQTYLGIFQPGFCTNGSTPPFSGGRPIPGNDNLSDSNPTTRPF